MTKHSLLILGLVCSACVAPAKNAGSAVAFKIESGFGDESDWVLEHLEASTDLLFQLTDNQDIAPQRRRTTSTMRKSCMENKKRPELPA